MTTPAGGSAAASNTLTTDFELMRHVAGQAEARNEEIRAMLHSFIGRMTSVPATVWGGAAATAFRGVVDRWNTESLKLHQALQGIAETIRSNERALAAAAEAHSQQLGSVASGI
ncbi:WXG100 family type VII secretion target [Mycobacterium sp. MYCO198283]|uniref:WXG100 family type VII secretion target n=1 Tax=Mycobacterium sp. MYCO198283 TaxID=2883505 RepID=UPI001E43FF9A|nr:WXG100 family type VII secretion target [Mycobacterium sp. MYCO198283]MCG5431794.1 WXG100 family type VII secretion target [Mycobacterium sp. MYCO198283]